MKDLLLLTVVPLIEFVIIYAVTGDIATTFLVMVAMTIVGLVLWMLIKLIGADIE